MNIKRQGFFGQSQRKIVNIILFFLLISGFGQASYFSPANASGLSVLVVGVMPSQAMLKYTAPDSSPCTVKVSESPSLRPLVHDVDPNIFPGADSDARSGNLVSGPSRIIIIGKRNAEKGSDQSFYSRALQAYTTHYFQITCGSSIGTGNFQTANIPLGNNYGDPLLVDPNKPGDYAIPTLSMTDRNQELVDPQTGMLIKRVSLPGDKYEIYTNKNFGTVTGLGWSNPQAAQSGDSAAATIVSSAGNLFLKPNFEQYFSQEYHAIYAWEYPPTLTDLRLNVTGKIGIIGPGEDNKVVVCLSVDGVNCYQNADAKEITLSTTFQTYSVGSDPNSTAVDLWQSPGKRPLNTPEIGPRRGSITCDGSQNVKLVAGYSNPLWTNGSIMSIDGTNYVIQNVVNDNQLSLQQNCPAGSHNFIASNFSILLHKKIASNNQVSIEHATVDAKVSYPPRWTVTPADRCSEKTVARSSTDQSQGYVCMGYYDGLIYWINDQTGEAHVMARDLINQQGLGWCDGTDKMFDANNPDVLYCQANNGVFKVQYFGSHDEPGNTKIPGRFEASETLPACNSSKSNMPCNVVQNLTKGTNLGTLINAFDSSFQPDRFSCDSKAVDDGVILITCPRGAYGSLGWVVVFDPNATSNGEPGNAGCTGGGTPGCVIAAMASWKSPNNRWSALKGIEYVEPGWMVMFPYFSPGGSNPGAGPYESKVADGTAFNTQTDVPGGLNQCPANSLGVSGKVCTQVRVDGEPRDPDPCNASAAACGGAIETGAPGEIGNAMPGDYIMVGQEEMLLVQKSGANNLTWTLKRNIGNKGLQSSGANPVLYFVMNTNPVPSNNDSHFSPAYWNFRADPHALNPTGTTITGNLYGYTGHSFYRNHLTAVAYTEDPLCRQNIYPCYQSTTGPDLSTILKTPPQGVEIEAPKFAGKTAIAGPNETQMHPGFGPLNATGYESKFFYDARPFNGDYTTKGNGTKFSGQLWKFSNGSLRYFDRKIYATMASVGIYPLKDISGPGVQITTDASDSYTYCVAVSAGECYFGSNPGDVYVNAPLITEPYCYPPGQATPGPDNNDVCITNSSAVYNSVREIGHGVDLTGANQRTLTKGLSHSRLNDVFWNVNFTADGKWMLMGNRFLEGYENEIILGKMLPTPQPDGIDRTTFIPVSVNIPAPSTVAATAAVVEFGYGENGDPARHYCTSRQEACVATASSVNVANPFFYAQSETYSGASCANGCTIAIPSIPQRATYYTIKYLDQSGAVVATGDSGVALETASASIQGGVTIAPTPTPTLTSTPTPTPIPTPTTVPDTTMTGPDFMRPGVLVQDGSTLYVVTGKGTVTGFSRMSILRSYGYDPKEAVKTSISALGYSVVGTAGYANGTLILDKGTIYQIVGQYKHPFVSYTAFKKLGYTLKTVYRVDTSKYQLGNPITGTGRHLAGVNVVDGTTHYYVGDSTLYTYPTSAEYSSWHIDPNSIVKAVPEDLALPHKESGFRDGTLLNNNGQYELYSQGQRYKFDSIYQLKAFGFNPDFAIKP